MISQFRHFTSVPVMLHAGCMGESYDITRRRRIERKLFPPTYPLGSKVAHGR